MSLFQNSVVNKHLANQDKSKLVLQWNIFKNHFHNTIIQDNIRNSKEEQYQGEFLIDLFVNVLGYVKNPTPNFTLTTEYKNVKDSKKADGAILVNNKVKAVIELKGTNTTDLGKIEVQAFGYKNNQPNCDYVITSNFEKLRFYIDNATEFLEFNLFQLTEKEFELLYLCLAYENVANDVPKKLKEQSLSKEKDITKALYIDYSLFKRELHQDLVKLNTGFDALELFKKSQKLLDRFLFLFFAEDRQLLPPNSVRLILKQWEKLKELDEYVPLYARFKKYFGYLNTGFKGKQHDVFAYNGGLFKPDDVLDVIKIDDELLYKHTLKLSEYDFASEVDVNILGHIFENSLNELDEIKAQLEGTLVEKATTKRKKDGVFYTPKYITKYIVDNTIGKLCLDKKLEFKIDEEDYVFIKTIKTKVKRGEKNFPNEKKEGLSDKLTMYRNWLLNVTICDPACGSGAFLNQALDFLIQEHRYIDELQAKLFGDALVLSDVEKSILENNLFGVDLNEESVEIAKLSLWLRTARPNRKLNDLNNNIKCGNSLINDVAIAGEKAFNWQKAFPQVFINGGFDVIIGNPPYLVVKGGRWIGGFEYDNNSINWIKENYKTAEQQINTYILFLELSKNISKNEIGIISQITPNTFFANEYSKKIRSFLIEDCNLIELNNTGLVFEDASVETAITIYYNSSYKGSTKIINHGKEFEIDFNKTKCLTEDCKYLIRVDTELLGILNKLNVNPKLEEYGKVWRGLTTGNDKKYLSDFKINEEYKPLITGSEIQRYIIDENKKFVHYLPKELDRPRDERIFLLDEKLISKFVGNRLTFGYDNLKRYVVNTACSVEIINDKCDVKFLMAILNSKLLDFYFQLIFSDSRSTFPIMKSGNIESLPIKYISLDKQTPFVAKANNMLLLSKELQEQSQKFQRTLTRKFELTKLPNKLQEWYLLTYSDFIKELTKQKIKLSLSEEAEWEEYFTAEAKKVLALKTAIDNTDKEIDDMVYKLYDLTEEEILIVENS